MQRLNQRAYVGLGEFHLSVGDTSAPVVQAFGQVSAERGLFLHAHTDSIGVRQLALTYPDASILWAHAGMSADASTVSQVLTSYPNVWVELALRSDVAPGGRLDPHWSAVFQQHPDRFMIGTDTWITPQWTRLPQLMGAVRGWLDQLPRDLAERIAFGNAEGLFK